MYYDSQRGYAPMDAHVCFLKKQQVVLWVTTKADRLLQSQNFVFKGSKFAFGYAQNRLSIPPVGRKFKNQDIPSIVISTIRLASFSRC